MIYNNLNIIKKATRSHVAVLRKPVSFASLARAGPAGLNRGARTTLAPPTASRSASSAPTAAANSPFRPSRPRCVSHHQSCASAIGHPRVCNSLSPARPSTRPPLQPGDTHNHDSGGYPSPPPTHPPPLRLPRAPSTPASDPTTLVLSPALAAPRIVPAETQNNRPTIPAAALPAGAPIPSSPRPNSHRQNPLPPERSCPTAAPPSETARAGRALSPTPRKTPAAI